MANIVWQDHVVTKQQRSEQKGQKPCLIWFTGLSGAGKSTIANELELELYRRGQHTYILDGDNVRHGLSKDLGFCDADREENIRRIGEASRLFVEAGLIVISAFISPFRSDRRIARELFAPGEFIEVYMSAPLTVCEARDPKGLYKKARCGDLKHFTGIDSPYEVPEDAEVSLNTAQKSIKACVKQIIDYLIAHDRIK
ncbi:adenylyl-sulfate kinase [Teredinibacter haidensis]|uniref:adenylyl-sulfate kinase n=1 Tax=Teredinibacter haidensis TaxID=2731755 RepID=UPI000948CE79|nr:adenylyl-sulfate kinase [Teredinibacter haidensis]